MRGSGAQRVTQEIAGDFSIREGESARSEAARKLWKRERALMICGSDEFDDGDAAALGRDEITGDFDVNEVIVQAARRLPRVVALHRSSRATTTER